MAEVKVTTIDQGGWDKYYGEVMKREKMSITVGFFADAKYPDGTPVAEVATEHEYGIGVPERPFFRQALRKSKPKLEKVIKKQKHLADFPSWKFAMRIGAWLAYQIQRSAIDLKTPPNAPWTIEQKGSSNPLIDTGVMVRSVTYEVKSPHRKVRGDAL